MAISSLHEFGLARDSLETSIQQESKILLKEVEKHEKKALKINAMFHKAVSNIICSALFGRR